MTNVVLGYDGSPSSAAAIDGAARFLPGAQATIAHLWRSPILDPNVRDPLARRAGSLDELIALVEGEGEAEAERVAANGVAIARAAGWEARSVTQRVYGGEGYALARLAEELAPDALVLGSRGLGGVRAVLGSTSDIAVHVSTVPVMVVPHPLLSDERQATAAGPVVVGYDGSSGARHAVQAAARLFGRRLVVATVSTTGAEAAEHGTLKVAGAEGAEVVVLDSGGSRGRDVASPLLRLAGERGAGLIVVGSRGRSATREILLGSVAMAVLHHAHRPVLVVPEHRYSAVD